MLNGANDLQTNPTTKPGNQRFVFIGTTSFADYHAAHLTVFGMLNIVGTILRGNVNADFAADFWIRVPGVSLVATDIVP